MSCAERAIRALILHDWKDARERKSALTVPGDVTDNQLEERVRFAIISPSEPAQDIPTFEKAKSGSKESPPFEGLAKWWCAVAEVGA